MYDISLDCSRKYEPDKDILVCTGSVDIFALQILCSGLRVGIRGDADIARSITFVIIRPTSSFTLEPLARGLKDSLLT